MHTKADKNYSSNNICIGDRLDGIQGGSAGLSLIDFFRYSCISVSALSRNRSSRLMRSELICRRGLVHSVLKVLCTERGDTDNCCSVVTSKLSMLFCRRCFRGRSWFLRGNGGRPSMAPTPPASSSAELSSVDRVPYLSRSSLCSWWRNTALPRSS